MYAFNCRCLLVFEFTWQCLHRSQCNKWRMYQYVLILCMLHARSTIWPFDPNILVLTIVNKLQISILYIATSHDASLHGYKASVDMPTWSSIVYKLECLANWENTQHQIAQSRSRTASQPLSSKPIHQSTTLSFFKQRVPCQLTPTPQDRTTRSKQPKHISSENLLSMESPSWI